MLDVKKWMAKVSDYLRKRLVGTVSNVYWWGNSWTAPSDGMMVLRITPTNNSAWYLYINDSSISGTTGSWSHQFRGANNSTFTSCIPVKKGATYSTAAGSNLNTIYCFFYPMKVGGVLRNSIFKAFSDSMSLLKIGGGVDAGCKEVTDEGASTASILLRIQRVQLKYHYALWFRVHEFCYRNAIGNRKRDGISIPFRPEQRSYLSALSALLKCHYIQTNLLGWLLGELGDKQLTISERGWARC